MGFSRTPSAQGRRDGNAAEIADALRAAGASVVDLGGVGRGVPDLLVGYLGTTYLIEVKSPETHARRAKGPVPYHEFLTDDQIAFLASWRGCVVRIVTTVDEAMAEIGAPLRAAGRE